MKLVEVLRAGDQFNLEEDVSYDQILFIVEQLVKDKQVDVANAAVSPKPSRKFMKENAELKKRCRELEEKLAGVETKPREDDQKDQEIADLRQHLQDAESRAVELEKVVAEKEMSLQAKSKEEQLILMRSKKLEEERS